MGGLGVGDSGAVGVRGGTASIVIITTTTIIIITITTITITISRFVLASAAQLVYAAPSHLDVDHQRRSTAVTCPRAVQDRPWRGGTAR
jgi:hypothetical protein